MALVQYNRCNHRTWYVRCKRPVRAEFWQLHAAQTDAELVVYMDNIWVKFTKIMQTGTADRRSKIQPVNSFEVVGRTVQNIILNIMFAGFGIGSNDQTV